MLGNSTCSSNDANVRRSGRKRQPSVRLLGHQTVNCHESGCTFQTSDEDTLVEHMQTEHAIKEENLDDEWT